MNSGATPKIAGAVGSVSERLLKESSAKRRVCSASSQLSNYSSGKKSMKRFDLMGKESKSILLDRTDKLLDSHEKRSVNASQ